MTKKIAVLVADLYEDLELWYPYYRMKEAGYDVIKVGSEGGTTHKSYHTYPCTTDCSIADIKASDYDAVICPGGFSPDYLRRDQKILAFIRDLHAAGKTIAAICHGPWMLCSAGIAKGKRVTCFHAIKDDLINAGGLYEDAPVVVDGNIITSRFPPDLPDFCKAILSRF